MPTVASSSPPGQSAASGPFVDAASASPATLPATGDEAATYASSVVQLPPTVPELIQCLEQQHERCAQLTRCLERVQRESCLLAASSAGTSAEGRYEALSAAAAEGTTRLSSPPAEGSPTAPIPPPPPSSTSLARPAAVASSAAATAAAHGVSAPSNTGAGASSTRAVASEVVRPTALTGKLVGTVGAAPSSTMAVRAVVVTADPSTATPNCALATAMSAEEVAELRVRVMALETTQQLLTNTQSELSTTQSALTVERERLKAALADLAQLRKEILTDANDSSSPLPQAAEAPVSPAHQLAEVQTRLAERETEVHAARLRYESAAYALTQLQETVSAMTREKAFLQEKITHLEGQLQRLLTSSMEAGAIPAPRPAPSAPRLTASEAYQKEALEKQINDLRAMADKLARDAKKQGARRAKAEELALALQKENAELKASALTYRRQMNESELELEMAISRKEEDERIRQLERDANRLRSALRDRSDEYEHGKAEWERQLLVLTRQLRVHEAAAKQLLRRMLAYQVREVMWQQCLHASTHRSHGRAATPATSPRVSCSDARELAPLTAVAASPSSLVPQAEGAAVIAVSGASPSCSMSSSVVFKAAADTAQLVDRERQLEELKYTFERRVALAEAQRKAETQQLLALNKELRQALALSQEVLNQKTKLLEAAQNRLPPSAAAQLRSAPAASMVASQCSSFSGVLRDASTMGVCRNDGEDGPAATSPDGTDNSNQLASTHILSMETPRQVTDIERRYNPERMTTWEAVQVENEALLDRLTTLQEEKWRLTAIIEDLQRQCSALRGELKRNASTMNQLLAAGVLTPAAVSRSSDEGRLRALQCLLHETLQAKLELEERLQEANAAAPLRGQV
ncbi:hypothetical protein GH5_04245 [Leishmania sp. Ghana 2012 LV757]|uniref:hypothetical protein n=1 Tax=Leishmania sp. Ghana 2012 LV757 TaxID=2803181 RepID=UPI001B5AA7CA|nr:hypothetical protein GH5_04245 [Leishmania sp. Ghana 2012 LV757]